MTDEMQGRDQERGADPEGRLAAFGYPVMLPPAGAKRPYEPLMQVGDIVYGSGNTSMDRHTGVVFSGRVSAASDAEVDLEAARERARVATINALAGLKAHFGELSRIRRVIRLTGYVSSEADFTQQADVINAASELLLKAFGDRGRHARSALGVAQLPGGASVEVELIVEVEA